ncbi:MAG TPA: hypothetical protein VN673_11220, partial [Clostridia bacterium]|nr:hypothetical protein [Clostridia bacterium]
SALESETKSVLKEHLETLSAKQNQILAEIKRLMEPFCETVREAEDIANGCWAFRQLEFERASLKTMPFASQAKRLVQIYGAPARD